MGLIRAALGSAGGVLADQWKDYFYCDSLSADVLMAKGQKRVSSRSSNRKGSDNIISNGSVININEGQCMMIVESGLVVDICAQPGEYVYDASTEPSIFAGDLEGNIKAVFRTMCKRFTFGGEAPKDQRIYFFNTKELTGHKFGTANPIPFRVVDARAAIDIDIGLRCFGTYSIQLVNPLLFYRNLGGNVPTVFKVSDIEDQLRSELLTALQPAFARLSSMGIRYSEIPGYTKELAAVLKEEMSPEWSEGRGIEIKKVAFASLSANPDDEKMIKEMQRNTAFMDPARGAAHMVGSAGSAMQTAAGNSAGAMAGFMGMGMTQSVSGVNAQSLYAMGRQQAAQAPVGGWKCSCGAVANGKFCPECGSKKPEAEGWQCSCGTVNKGKFCTECGTKKPAGVPQYRCDKCGWKPADPTKPPRFCPECGDPFGDEDIV